MIAGALGVSAPRAGKNADDGATLMTFADSFLSNAGWLFFTAWSVIVAVVTVKAFGRDLLPSKADLDAPPGPCPPHTVRSTQSRAR